MDDRKLIKVTSETHKQLKALAVDRGVTMVNLITEIVNDACEPSCIPTALLFSLNNVVKELSVYTNTATVLPPCRPGVKCIDCIHNNICPIKIRKETTPS